MAWGQQGPETAPVSQETSVSPELETPTALQVITQSINILESEMARKQADLKSARTQDQKIKILNEMKELDIKLAALEKNYEEIATGVDLELFDAERSKKFDLKQELQELLGPIIEEMKSITAQPRLIEKLRGEVGYFKQRLPVANKAVENITNLSEQIKDQKLKRKTDKLKQVWEDRARQISNQLAIAQYQLDEKLNKKRSFIESAQSFLKIFFKSRGRNLILSIVAFILVFFLFKAIRKLIDKLSPSRRLGRRSHFLKVVDVAYYIFTFIAATGALLAVLYIAGDWVLLALALIFIFGIAWTAKQGLPIFWEQLKVLLNLGTVRENERVVYNGIPWRVDSLNIYSTLVNPDLKGGRIRLPLRQLITLNSRPYDSKEPWFPCREDDWLILSDGTHGKVVKQSPDTVQLVLLGGSRKTYITNEFLSLNPVNISSNFRINVTFGVDYRHQSISVREVPEKLMAELRQKLDWEGYGNDIISLKAEFKEAASSSLDIAIMVDFSGNVAEKYNILQRTIQRIAVETCNKEGWVIPFTQITLHTADNV